MNYFRQGFSIIATASLLLSAEGNAIDAVSSASRKFNITGGTAYETAIDIDWYSGYSNGQTFFSWGTREGSYPNKQELKYSSKGKHKATINGFEPGTQYYFDLWTLYKGKERHTCLGTFTTFAQTTALSLSKEAPQKSILIFPQEHSIELQLPSNVSFSATIFTANGREVFSRSGTSSVDGISSIDVRSLATGMYVLSVQSEGVSLSHKFIRN